MPNKDIQSDIQNARDQAVENSIKSIANYGLCPYGRISKDSLFLNVSDQKVVTENSDKLFLYAYKPSELHINPDGCLDPSVPQLLCESLTKVLLMRAWDVKTVTPTEKQQRLLQSMVILFKGGDSNTPFNSDVQLLQLSSGIENRGILAILVPNHLKGIVEQHFSYLKAKQIIGVPPNKGDLQLAVPDYQSALATWIPQYFQPEFGECHADFVFHAVRLHTEHDFTPRFIEDSVLSAELLQKTKGRLLSQGVANEGWWLFHRQQVVGALEPLQAAKGEYTMSLLPIRYVNDTLLTALQLFDVHSTLKHHGMVIASYLTTRKNDINKLVMAFSKPVFNKIMSYLVQEAAVNESLIILLLERTPQQLALVEPYLTDSATNMTMDVNSENFLKAYNGGRGSTALMTHKHCPPSKKFMEFMDLYQSSIEIIELQMIGLSYLRYCAYSLQVKKCNTENVTLSVSNIIFFNIMWTCVDNYCFTSKIKNKLQEWNKQGALTVVHALIVDTLIEKHGERYSKEAVKKSLPKILTAVLNTQSNALCFYSVLSQFCIWRIDQPIINILIEHATAINSDVESIFSGLHPVLLTADNLIKVLQHPNIKGVALAMKQALDVNRTVDNAMYNYESDLDRALAIPEPSTIASTPSILGDTITVDSPTILTLPNISDEFKQESEPEQQKSEILTTPRRVLPVAQKEWKRPYLRRSGSISKLGNSNASLQRTQSMFFVESKKEKRQSMKITLQPEASWHHRHYYIRAQNTDKNLMFRMGFSENTIRNDKPSIKSTIQAVLQTYTSLAEQPRLVTNKKGVKGIVKLSITERVNSAYKYKMKDSNSDYRVWIRQEDEETKSDGRKFYYYVADMVKTHKKNKVVYQAPSREAPRHLPKPKL